ncbi:hypothetical protein M3Y99_01448300 [Aphelenchoides fujianensis]|nr:hypothetical protein M3Y99_01448300 [Aphelenchoides fujianensis]
MVVRWLLFVLVLAIAVGIAAAAPFTTDFKCAGDSGRTCDSGFCFDTLVFPEGTQEVGCAEPGQCSQVGCFMAENRFTCCCAKNRFCNGKSDSLMWSKFRIFRSNGNSWPTFVPPRIFARNVTTEAPKTKVVDTNVDAKDIRLAPPRRTTTEAAARKSEAKAKPQTTTTRTSSTFETSTESAAAITDSTTTEFAVLSSSTAARAQAEPKIVKENVEKPTERKEPPAAAHSTTTVGQPASSGRLLDGGGRPNDSLLHVGRLEHRQLHHQAKKSAEVDYPRAFPWYYVTILGFIISLIIFALLWWLVRKIRARRRADNSARNSVDSSQISDAHPNERGSMNYDPLLASKAERNGR